MKCKQDKKLLIANLVLRKKSTNISFLPKFQLTVVKKHAPKVKDVSIK